MIKQDHIDGGIDTLRAALSDPRENTHYDSTKEALDFYMKDNRFQEVHVVTCLDCGYDMCIEVLEPQSVGQFQATHHQGRRRITLGDEEYPGGRLLSHRKRLDGAMGYRCVCGNNTVISSPEKGLIPQTNDPNKLPTLPAIEPHQEARLRIEMTRSGYKPDIEIEGNKTRIETFMVERLK